MRETLDLNPQFKLALELMREDKKNLFITGKAGVGKSTLLDYFCSLAKKKPVVLAPTGVSALNVKGQTIHSFFNFYIDVTVEGIKKMKRPKQPELYKKLKTIIIDEVSMVRADLMDCVEVFLRRFGPKPGQIFGGVQMIFIGDLYQLPPVVSSKERSFFSTQYKSPFFFSSSAFKNFEIEIIELEKVYRQKDQKFVDLLNRIRNNSVQPEDIKCLNSRYLPFFKPNKNEFYITLSSTNQTADQINGEQLKKLRGKSHRSIAFIEGKVGKEHYPTSPDLRFKAGAQIMLVNNDQKRRWVNGSIGIIDSFDREEEALNVRLHAGGKLVSVYQHQWEIYNFSFSKDKKAIVSELAGSFTQFPFRLAWAITIHKSQGKTFNRVVIDLSRGMFASGQAYVALSRCVSLKGLVLKEPFKKQHIRTDYRIMDFLTQRKYQKAEREMPLLEKSKIIKKAINEGKKLKMTYLKANDSQSERVVQPLSSGPMIYKDREFQGLKAFCLKAQEERSFRLDRILKLKCEK